METLFNTLPGIVALLSAAAVFLKVNGMRDFHKYMAFTLIFDGLFSIMSVTVFLVAERFSPFLYILYTGLMLAVPVLYYLASVSMLKMKGVRAGHMWMPLVAAVYVAAMAVALVGSSTETLDLFNAAINGTATAASMTDGGVSILLSLDSAACVLFLAMQLFVIVYSMVNLKRYMTLLGTYYSDLSGKSWLQFAVILVIAVVRFVMDTACIFLPLRDGAQLFDWLDMVMVVVSCIFYVAVAMFVCPVRFSAHELETLIEKENAERENTAAVCAAGSTPKTTAAGAIIAQRLEKLIESRFYLDSAVDLIWLSQKLQVNSKYVADYLRQTYDETFLSFVNRLRIEHSISLMQKPELSLTEIGEQSGYQTASTYYRNFQRIKGMSPSDYRKKTFQQ